MTTGAAPRRAGTQTTKEIDVADGPSKYMEGGAIALILAPIWYPFVEEGGFSWPRGGSEIAGYAFVVCLGLAMLWWERRKA